LSNRTSLKNKLIRLIPIYGAYKAEEELREWDRSIRDEAILHLKRSEERIRSMLEKAVKDRDRTLISKVESARKKIHNIKENIKTATYGYFPRSSPIKIKESTLKNALEMDENIVKLAQGIYNKIEVLSNKFQDKSKEAIFDLEQIYPEIRVIQDYLTKRKLLFRKGHLEEES
jgi:hypothetical protein